MRCHPIPQGDARRRGVSTCAWSGRAMGSGTAATRAVAKAILLDNDFATLPAVVAEGRRVIANVERTGSLFVTKNWRLTFRIESSEDEIVDLDFEDYH